MAEHGLEAVAFPKLSEAQIEQHGRYAGAPPKKLRAGEALFRVGDRDFRFFVVKSGEVEIIDETGDKPRTVTVHRPGSFTDDVNHLTGLRVIDSRYSKDASAQVIATLFKKSKKRVYFGEQNV